MPRIRLNLEAMKSAGGEKDFWGHVFHGNQHTTAQGAAADTTTAAMLNFGQQALAQASANQAAYAQQQQNLGRAHDALHGHKAPSHSHPGEERLTLHGDAGRLANHLQDGHRLTPAQVTAVGRGAPVKSAATKGDLVGHPFRGNQFSHPDAMGHVELGQHLAGEHGMARSPAAMSREAMDAAHMRAHAEGLPGSDHAHEALTPQGGNVPDDRPSTAMQTAEYLLNPRGREDYGSGPKLLDPTPDGHGMVRNPLTVGRGGAGTYERGAGVREVATTLHEGGHGNFHVARGERGTGVGHLVFSKEGSDENPAARSHLDAMARTLAAAGHHVEPYGVKDPASGFVRQGLGVTRANKAATGAKGDLVGHPFRGNQYGAVEGALHAAGLPRTGGASGLAEGWTVEHSKNGEGATVRHNRVYASSSMDSLWSPESQHRIELNHLEHYAQAVRAGGMHAEVHDRSDEHNFSAHVHVPDAKEAPMNDTKSAAAANHLGRADRALKSGDAPQAMERIAAAHHAAGHDHPAAAHLADAFKKANQGDHEGARQSLAGARNALSGTVNIPAS